MSEIIWNWQRKSERLRKLLEQNALNCTFDIKRSITLSELSGMPFVPSAHHFCEYSSRQSLDMNRWSTTNSHVSEHLMNVIDYCDFEDGMGCAYCVSSGESVASIHSTKAECSTPVFDIVSNKEVPIKHNVACNTSVTNFDSKNCIKTNGAVCSHNCLRMLETAKSNITKLIDNQIELICHDSRVENDKTLHYKKFEKYSNDREKASDARKNIEILNCIGQLRKKIFEIMTKLDQLINELEHL